MSCTPTQIPLRYGCNPHQKHARLTLPAEGALRVVNGSPGYINMLDALGAWQLVRELKQVTGLASAASFKHTSPAGAAVAKPLSQAFARSQMIDRPDLSPAAQAYARARGGDRMCSYGDLAAVSETVDADVANLLKPEVSDGLIAPGYTDEALAILKAKRKGGYLVMQIDPAYEPPASESRRIFGFTLEQDRNDGKISRGLLSGAVSKKKHIPDGAAQSLLVATVALKYTQSNSVCVAYDGQVIGMGAGQQSRVHCTRLACDKADKWLLQHHPRVLDLPFKADLPRAVRTNIVDQFLLWDQLSPPEQDEVRRGLTKAVQPLSAQERADWIGRHDGIVISSDAFFPFRDNIDRASRSHVQYVLQPGGSVRDDDVTAAADQYGMVMIHSGMRWFLH